MPLFRQTQYLGRYRQIAEVFILHGFGYVVEQLGLHKLLSISNRSLFVAPSSTVLSAPERLRETLVDLGPTFVKIGQFLSTRSDMLPPDFVHELSKLQDAVPPFPSDQAIAIVEKELGHPISELFQTFEYEPIAAGSLGQVHAAVLPSGEHVAVKIQRPHIERQVETDLAIITDLATLAQENLHLGQALNLEELAREFSTILRNELNYNRERRNAERFRMIFTDNPNVHIPTIYSDYCTSHVLTTERLFAPKINNIPALHAAGIDPTTLAKNSTGLIFQEIFSGFFHGDPHPGNFFALPNNVIGAIDFGQVGVLDHTTARQMMFLVLAMTRRDTDNAVRAMIGIGILERHSITPAIRRDVQMLIEGVTGVPLSEVSMQAIIADIFAMSRRHSLSMPSPVVMLLRSLFMMEGIGRQLDPHLDIFAIAKPYVDKEIADQLSPDVLYTRLSQQGRLLTDELLELPGQVINILGRIEDGKLTVQTHERELKPAAQLLARAIDRLALSIIIAALIPQFRSLFDFLRRRWVQ